MCMGCPLVFAYVRIGYHGSHVSLLQVLKICVHYVMLFMGVALMFAGCHMCVLHVLQDIIGVM